MKFRTFLLGLSALFVASNAAYFSVSGLSSLFAGATVSVIIMTSSLEFAKLISASFLYNYWSDMNKILRTYLLIGVSVLMLITSAGIYGFLTSAYQTTSDKLDIVDHKMNIIELKKDRFLQQISTYDSESKNLNNSITALSKGLSNNVIQYKDKETGKIITTTSSSTRKLLSKELDDAKNHREVISSKMEILRDSVNNIDIQILQLKTDNGVDSEIGPLRYISKITNKPMDTVVNWFALMIIFVFDPLAVTLVVAFATALKIDGNIKTTDDGEIKKKVR